MKLIISLATRIIPRHYLQHVSHFFLRIFSLFLRGNKFEDPMRRTPSIDKIVGDTGYQPSMNIPNMIKKIIEYKKLNN